MCPCMRGVPIWPHVSEELTGRHPHGQNHPQLSRMHVLCSCLSFRFVPPTRVSPADATLSLALHTDHLQGRQLSWRGHCAPIESYLQPESWMRSGVRAVCHFQKDVWCLHCMKWSRGVPKAGEYQMCWELWSAFKRQPNLCALGQTILGA